MTPRRLRLLLVLAVLLTHAGVLLAWTQEWFGLRLAASGPLGVDGAHAAPALPTLALAGLALAGALTIAGPITRVVLGAVQFVLSATIVFSAVIAVTDPIAASAATIGEVTGLGGAEATRDLVESVVISLWPWAVVVLGVLGAALGIVVAVTFRRWPVAARKYQAEGLQAETSGEASRSDWETLSDGRDPTE